MNRNDRIAIVVFVALILLGFLLWSWHPGGHGGAPVTEAPPMPSASKTGTPVTPRAATPAPKLLATPPAPKVVPPPAPTKPAAKKIIPPKAAVASSEANGPTPPAVQLHKELIPKDITIARCYYSQEVAPPGTHFDFDIDGSGFTEAFEKMISVDANQPEVHIKELKLVTPNQIHGTIEVGTEAPTKFVFPRVLIKGLPVFTAPEPFAVIRPGEVLAIFFIQMQENGRGGRFRVLTNLTPDAAKDFKVEPSTPGLMIANMEMHLPYAIDADIQIAPRVIAGEYGLTALVGSKEVFKRTGLIRIVRPNVGQSGLVHGLTAQDAYHRPGDPIQLYMEGTGLSPNDASSLVATVNEFDMGQGSFTYLSASQMRIVFSTTAKTPLGSYSVSIKNAQGEKVYEKKDVFHLIGANWVAGVQVTPPVHPGQKGALKIVGRDFSPEFVSHLKVETDADGVTIGAPHAVNASGLEAEITISTTVAPGDYWLHLSADGKKIDPPYGSIIKVEP